MNNIYKAKSIDSGKWVFGQYIFQDGVPYIRSIENNKYIPIDVGTVSYFFGFHKKLMKNIWENDILEFNNQKYVLQHLKELEEFVFVSISSDKILTGDITNIIADSKIIGNIFDNFELIAEGEQENIDRRK